MLDFIWNMFQHRQIGQLNDSLANNLEKNKYQDNKINSTAARFRELEQRHEQLKLVTMAMWTLLKEHTGLTESELRKYVDKVDLMDGKADGKVDTREKCNCTQCGRTILTTALACPYCGGQLHRKSVFSRA
jgi:type I site-specific restriction endonuclease